MSSYFDEASLVMIPSGYKTSKLYSVKPTDGSGDMAFTRSNDTATRVGPDGLIEKVRTNLALYSEDLTNVIYAKSNATVTSNSETAPDGTLTADTITATSAFGQVQGAVVITSGIVYTMSVWLKRKTGTGQVSLRGVSNTSTPITITSDWVRYSVSLNAADTSGRYGVILNTSGDEVYAWGFQLEVGDVMTDYIPTTTAAVSVGPVANVPRLDYLNSSCPRLLLEPQRTNLITYSEQLNDSSWSTSTTTVTANAEISPDGYQNADVLDMSASQSRVSKVVSLGAGTYSVSVYAKSITGSGTARILVIIDGVSTDFVFTPTTSWARYTFTFTAATSVTAVQLRAQTYIGDLAFWGAQLELGSYASSYIPTLGAAVTRGADACSKTGISSLIGQTEGTIYLEADIQKRNESGFYVAISAGAVLATSLYLFQPSSGNLQVLIRNTGNPDGSITINSANWTAGFNKVAIAYTATTAEVFINGVSKGSTSFVSLPALSQLTLGARPDVTGSLVGAGPYSQALLFKTRLTNAQLAELTA